MFQREILSRKTQIAYTTNAKLLTLMLQHLASLQEKNLLACVCNFICSFFD